MLDIIEYEGVPFTRRLFDFQTHFSAMTAN